MMKIQPYLNFDGKAEEAFNFYQSVFGGEFIAKMTMEQAPDSDKLTGDERNRIMHVSLSIGDGIVLMASDIAPSVGHKLSEGNNVYISLHPESREEAERIFRGLSEGGDIEMPLADQFWGDYYGSFSDRYGVHWMVNFSEES